MIETCQVRIHALLLHPDMTEQLPSLGYGAQNFGGVRFKYSFSSEMTAQFESVLCKWIFTILAMIADVNEFQELNIHSCEFYF